MIFDRDTYQPDTKPAPRLYTHHQVFWLTCGVLILGLVVGSISGAMLA